VLRTFDPPATPWGAGHRGVDLPAGPGTAVRAAAPGEVAFSGLVGGTPVLVVQLAGNLRTTYEPVRGSVPVGTAVAAGARLGTVSGALPHCPGGCLHWGLLSGDVYLDPLTLLPRSLLRSEPSRLLPLGDDYGSGYRTAYAHPAIRAGSRAAVRGCDTGYRAC
jgi:murein DD-endopeptidase MepM/ murein hydrolase activator NlpD